jgi:dihydrofolate reductase
MVIGGASVYRAFLPRADRIYWTLIEARFEGDTRIPPFDAALWREVERRDHEPDERNPWRYSFRVLERPGRLDTPGGSS